MVYNPVQYSVGTGVGISLKLALKVPKFVMLSFASGFSDLILKKSLIDSKAEAGHEIFII